MHLRIKDEQTPGEFLARIFHVVIGVLCICLAVWVLLSVSPFNPYAFFIPLLLGQGPLWVGLCGDRKDVFQWLGLWLIP